MSIDTFCCSSNTGEFVPTKKSISFMHYFREVFTNFTLLKLFHPILKLSYDANEYVFL